MLRPIPDLTETERVRFWSKVTRGRSGCLVWTAYRTPRGYGMVTIRGRVYRASRVAWKLKTGEDPGEFHVLHSCDYPPCLEHLFLGTHVENMADMSDKGRTDRSHKAHGAAHYNSRLRESEVRSARARHAAGESISAIARSLKVHRITISDIVNHRTWKET